MFDIGFSEILVIAVVALIVIGPERLPGVARTLGHLFGRMQRYVNDVKSDIQREIELDELKKLRENVESSAREIEQSVSRDLGAAERELHEMQAALTAPLAQAQAPDPGAARLQADTPAEAAPRAGIAPAEAMHAPPDALEDAATARPDAPPDAAPRAPAAAGDSTR